MVLKVKVGYSKSARLLGGYVAVRATGLALIVKAMPATPRLPR